MTLTLSSPLEPGGPNATRGSLTFRRRRSMLELVKGGGSSDRSNSDFSTARYSNLWSPTQLAGYINSGCSLNRILGNVMC